jgi:hypothetical protein
LRAEEPAQRLDWRPQRPTITCRSGQRLPAWAVLYSTAAEDRAMRGPTGIVGLVVTIIVIYLVLHYLLGVI